MAYEIKGKIEVMVEPRKKYTMLGINRKDAPQFLFYLNALELKRISSFCVSEGTSYINLSYKTNPKFEIGVDQLSVNVFLTEEQFELLKCCCVDALMQDSQYKHHIDLESDLCDFTFYIKP